MKLPISMLLAVFLGLNAIAQNSLEGSITSEEGTPVLANIYISQIERGVATQIDGTYSLQNIPNGTYTVIYSSLGYKTQSIKLTFDGETTLVKDVTLRESVVEMEAVIVSTPFHKLQSDNVMMVERITSESLTRSGSPNLSQGISKIAGVSIISTGTGIGKPVIRGLSSNRVLTYAQGVRLENQQFGDEHGLGLNSAGIESVEVIKGPASLLYGSDALGGVLYFNPERFAEQGKFAGDAGSAYFSNTRGMNYTLGLKKSSEKLKWILRGTYNSYVDYQTGDGQRVTNSRYEEYDLKTGLRWQNSNWKSTVRYNYNRANIGIPEEIGEQTVSRDLLLPYQEIDNHILSWENKFFFNNSQLDVKAGYVSNNRREFEDSTNESSLNMKLNSITYDAKYTLPEWGLFETIAGVQGMFQDNTNLGVELLIPDARKIDFGIFATTHFHLEKIDMQAGMRLDTRSIDTDEARAPSDFNFIPAINRDFTSFNAALGAKIDISEQFLGRINLASGFRAPNLAELASNGVHEGTNRYEIGNANLTNEQNLQTDVSLEFRNDHIELFANGFYNVVNDYIFIAPTDLVIEDQNVFNYMQSDANLYGGEFGLHLHPHPLDWLHIESSFETVTGALRDGRNLPLIPANTLQNTFRFELKDNARFKKSFAYLTLENVFEQNNVSFFETTTNGYSLLSMGAGTTLQTKKLQWQLGFSVTNLTDADYISHLSRLKIDEIANQGRSFNFNLKVSI